MHTAVRFRVFALSFLLLLPPLAHSQNLSILAMENPPYMYFKEGKASGLHIDLVSAIAREAGISASYVFFPQARAIYNFTDEDYPVILATPAFFPDNTGYYFIPLFYVKILLFYDARRFPDFSWTTFPDLLHYRISDVISGIGTRLFDREFIPYETSQSIQVLFRKLREARTDLAVGADLVTYELLEELGSEASFIVPCTGQPLIEIPVGILIKGESGREKDLARRMTKGLKAIFENGEWDRIMHTYYRDHAIPKDSRELVRSWLGHSGL